MENIAEHLGDKGSVPNRLEKAAQILVVEDNWISKEFFSAALECLGAHIDYVPSRALALKAYNLPTTHYDLWLIDLHLPDGDGASLARDLKKCEPMTKAIGHTALPVIKAEQMCDFETIIHKPLSPAKLVKQVSKYLPQSTGLSVPGDQTTWDDISGLAALHGRHDHLTALRQLFLNELTQIKECIIQAITRREQLALQSILHKLESSCGFVGAQQLYQATRRLRHDLNNVEAQHHLIATIQKIQWIDLPKGRNNHSFRTQ